MHWIDEKDIVLVCVQETNAKIMSPVLAHGLFSTDTTNKDIMMSRLRESITVADDSMHTKIISEIRKSGRIVSFYTLDKEEGNYIFIGKVNT